MPSASFPTDSVPESAPTAQVAHERRPHLKALTGLRFFPALHVVLFHLALNHFGTAPAWVRNILNCGYVGVSLFFVLSGFILAYSYLGALHERPIELRAFYQARFARIYPVHLLGTLMMWPFYFAYLHATLSAFKALFKSALGVVFAASLLHAWLPATTALLNFPSWSLSNEAFFYALFPLVLPVVARSRPRRLVALIAALWGVSLLPPLVCWIARGPGDPWTPTFWVTLLKTNPLLRLPEFGIGVLLGALFLLFASRPPRRAGLFSLLALGACLLVFTQSAFIPYVLLGTSLLAPLFAALIFFLAWDRGLLATFLSWSPIVLLGEASYSLYIFHIPVSTVLGALAPKLGISVASNAFFVFSLLVIVAFSVVMLQCVEKPARRALQKRGPFLRPRVQA